MLELLNSEFVLAAGLALITTAASIAPAQAAPRKLPSLMPESIHLGPMLALAC